jgi:Zn-dependent membrane protease YugP
VHDLIGARSFGSTVFWIFAIFVDHARDRLRVEIALRREVTIKASASQSGFRHHVVNRDGIEAVPIEQSAGALKDKFADSIVMLTRRRH